MPYKKFFSLILTPTVLNGLSQEQTLSNEWTSLIEDSFQELTLKKGNTLHVIGQIPEHIYFLRQGIVRAYYMDQDNRERTFYLWGDNTIATDIENYICRRRSELCIEVFNDAQLISISRYALDDIINKYPAAQKVLTGLCLYALTHHRQRDKDNQNFTATERYENFKTSDKTLAQNIPLSWSASYLGMSDAWIYELNSEKMRRKDSNGKPGQL